MAQFPLPEHLSLLEKHGQLVRLTAEIDPDQEMAAVHRRVCEAGGPALLFERVKGSPFPAVSNAFGTEERLRLLFGRTLPNLTALLALWADPEVAIRHPHRQIPLILPFLRSFPRQMAGGPVLAGETSLSQLPQIRNWPADGGAFITLPQVYSEDPDAPGIARSNLGMYRVQYSGGAYHPSREAGLHYQLHRGIGNHHAAAIRRGEGLKVSIFVGGPPAHAVAAVMPLPENVPEVRFAGVLAGRRFRYCLREGWVVSAEADFCILTVQPMYKDV